MKKKLYIYIFFFIKHTYSHTERKMGWTFLWQSAATHSRKTAYVTRLLKHLRSVRKKKFFCHLFRLFFFTSLHLLHSNSTAVCTSIFFAQLFFFFFNIIFFFFFFFFANCIFSLNVYIWSFPLLQPSVSTKCCVISVCLFLCFHCMSIVCLIVCFSITVFCCAL